MRPIGYGRDARCEVSHDEFNVHQLWIVRFLEGFLYGVEPYAPSILAAAFGTMVLIVIAASLVPMLRASRSDPAAVLREAP